MSLDAARDVPASGGGGAAPRTLSVLGATGSIGASTLDLVERSSGAFEIVALTANRDAEKLARLAIRHGATIAAVGDERAYPALKAALAGTRVKAAAGASGLLEAAAERADCVMAAIVGAAGLRPTLEAVRQGRRVALANKECLVCAGPLFMAEVARAKTELLPVDSEHSAAFQALGAADPECVLAITLTASGGPFRDWTAERIAAATPEAALKHPKWSMGPKISVDSATLMNKGLELIEAFHLFPVGAERLGVVVHPQSIVHCLVSFKDGSTLAQMSNPDMRTPIALSLSWPRRMAAPTPILDLVKIGTLTFEAPDETRFPALRVARDAMTCGAWAPVTLNAANEIAVEAFLDRRLPFGAIAEVVERCLTDAPGERLDRAISSVDDVLDLDREVRVLARRVSGAYF